MSTLSVLVDLEADGTYSLRIPGCPDKVPVRPGKLEPTIRTALHASALGEIQRTPKGGLTIMQQQCLRDHSEWPSGNCPLCRAAGRFSYGDYKSERAGTTRCPPGVTGAQAKALEDRRAALPQRESAMSVEDLGL